MDRRLTGTTACSLVFIAAAAAYATPPDLPGKTTQIDVTATGTPSDGKAFHLAVVSADGSTCVFASDASNLVQGDTNGVMDVFVKDLESGAVTRVSLASDGSQSNGPSDHPQISADGRFVVFRSDASNLVPGDSNGYSDIFLHDRAGATTERVSVTFNGAQSSSGSWGFSSVSADGRFVSFDSAAADLVPNDTNAKADIFVRDRALDTLTRVSDGPGGLEADDHSAASRLSADGLFVTFTSWATNLVPSDTNGLSDVFVHDMTTGGTTRVSVDSAGQQGDSLSGWSSLSDDGRFVTFLSVATNLVPSDQNGERDVFVHDTATGVTTRVSVDSDGQEGLGDSALPAISGDGRFVAFVSDASNLVPHDLVPGTDVYVHDRVTGTTRLASQHPLGGESDWTCEPPSISADGRRVAFAATASNQPQAVYVRDRGPWIDEGCALPGAKGEPAIVVGATATSFPDHFHLSLHAAAPGAPALLLLSATSSPAPFHGGILLKAHPVALALPFVTNAAGQVPPLPVDLTGLQLEAYLQFAIADSAAVQGVALSNALKLQVP